MGSAIGDLMLWWARRSRRTVGLTPSELAEVGDAQARRQSRGRELGLRRDQLALYDLLDNAHGGRVLKVEAGAEIWGEWDPGRKDHRSKLSSLIERMSYKLPAQEEIRQEGEWIVLERFEIPQKKSD